MNSTAVIAGITVFGALASSGLSSWSTFRVTKRTVVSSEGLLALQRKHDETQRALDRLSAAALLEKQISQDRLEKAYVSIQSFAQAVDDYSLALSIAYSPQTNVVHAFPTIDAQTNAFAALVASEEVVKLVFQLNQSASMVKILEDETALFHADRRENISGANSNFQDSQKRMREEARATHDLAMKLLNQMREEMFSH